MAVREHAGGLPASPVIELRCAHSLQGKMIDGKLEIKCRSYKCGARSGIIVLHRFDPFTGVLVETKRFRDPMVRR